MNDAEPAPTGVAKCTANQSNNDLRAQTGHTATYPHGDVHGMARAVLGPRRMGDAPDRSRTTFSPRARTMTAPRTEAKRELRGLIVHLDCGDNSISD